MSGRFQLAAMIQCIACDFSSCYLLYSHLSAVLHANNRVVVGWSLQGRQPERIKTVITASITSFQRSRG